jgi:methyl-accepting chemotaxis protein PixJ
MTQTSPKPAVHNTTNNHHPKSLPNGDFSSHTTPMKELTLDANSIESATLPPLRQSPDSFWQWLRQSWGNISLRTKLTIILMAGAAVPVIAATQGLILLSQNSERADLEESLKTQESTFVNDYLLWLKGESQWQANTIAQTVQAAGIDLQQPTQVKSNTPLLQALVTKMMADQDSTRPDFYKSFRIITNAQGRTVAQYIQIHVDYPLGSSPKSEEIIQPVSLPTGIDLGDIPIIKDALSTGRSLDGVELVEGKFIQRLGLDKQATVSLRPQPTKGLTESKQPFPEGSYPDVEQGRAGLVAMAVHPIKVQGKIVGSAVVGLLLNKNHSVVDSFSKAYNLNVTIFARDLRVSTTVPYRNSTTRATGTRAAREVAKVVLNQGKEFFGQTNVLGKEYLTDYSPLYDHQKELNPTGAKPVGMAFLGKSLEAVHTTTASQQELGYGIGGGMLVLIGLFAMPVAGSFARPLRRLAGFAQQVGTGKQGVRLEATSRQDEIGILSREMNTMAASIETNLEASRQQAERLQLFADIAASRVRDSQDLESVFNKAIQGAREILKADRVFIYSFNSDWSGNIIAEAVAPGCSSCLGAKVTDTYFTDSKVGVERYRNGRIFVIDDIYKANLTDCHLQLYERLEIRANVIAPIVRNDQLMGLLCAQQCDGPRAWQQFEVDFCAQLADQLGLSIDRVAFLEQITTAKDNLQRRALELLMEVDPVSKGDLTIRAQVTEDEIGTIADSYNATINSLGKIVTQVQTASKQVATTTSSSEVSVLELSKEALRQAQEITAALDQIQEMSKSIRAVAANAEQAEAAVQQANQTVKAGDAAMNRTVDGILVIRETVAETSKKVKRLGESSQKISKVVNLIGTFADKTNLLALNAAIEAANAGEQGRGFAVVAEQVRNLARQSAQATAEIESLVKDIQTETNEVVAAMEAGTEQVVTGTKLVDETRQSLNQITAQAAQIGALVDAIAQAAVAQSQVSESVTETMSDVAAIAQHTSTEATLVSTSFKELLAVAQELQTSVGQFKVS